MEKPFRHLIETDPVKVQLSQDIFERTYVLAREQAPQLCEALAVQRAFILNIYDEHLAIIDQIIEKYSEAADLVWRCGYHHPGGGPVIGLGFRVHPNVDLAAMVHRKLGIELPEN